MHIEIAFLIHEMSTKLQKIWYIGWANITYSIILPLTFVNDSHISVRAFISAQDGTPPWNSGCFGLDTLLFSEEKCLQKFKGHSW